MDIIIYKIYIYIKQTQFNNKPMTYGIPRTIESLYFYIVLNKNIETNTNRNLPLDADATPLQAIGYMDNGVAKGLTVETHLEEE